MEIQHQTHNTTQYDRYPDIFEFVKQSHPNPKSILSFGCSSGEECFSLRQYFHDALIYGIDISTKMIDMATRSNKDNKIFFDSSMKNIDNVDIIFSMSIFCRWPETSACDYNNIYKFDLFEHDIVNLDKVLNIGGLFIVYNANYYFGDTAIANKYEPLSDQFELREEFVRKFNKEGYISGDRSSIIFRKIC